MFSWGLTLHPDTSGVIRVGKTTALAELMLQALNAPGTFLTTESTCPSAGLAFLPLPLLMFKTEQLLQPIKLAILFQKATTNFFTSHKL